MELFILLVALAILAETTILVFRKYKLTSSNRRKIYVDTSALIDGRILNVAKSGFLDGDLIILRSVLLELQLLADGKDSDKRTRARAGLTVAAELERVVNINTEVVSDESGVKKVDEALLKYARENKGAILTLDYNLIKVAEAEKIEALNINELALATRSEFLPGERIKIKISEKGSGRGQGVGHLNDGTMVVVDGAASKVGRDVMVEFVKFYETPAGKMIFAKLAKPSRR
ncbi:TRAM domain-containing protein [Candidatus Saccharibacteria bacterium]|nr:TRAM domain-containing protein [Candidatus Saccharibacteria bacterium]